MSKAIFVCNRKDFPDTKVLKLKISSICHEISPDNIQSNEPCISIGQKTAYGISNPLFPENYVSTGFLLGVGSEKSNDWMSLDSGDIKGSFVLVRYNSNIVEVITDTLCSRTIWYYFDEELFIASTSQIAIVRYLGNFTFNEKTIPWMLSSGSPGPDYSWDKRVKKVSADTTLTLDRFEWKIKSEKKPVQFTPSYFNLEQAEKQLKQELLEAFNQYNFDYSKWALPLSGGHDSRAILTLLTLTGKSPCEIKTITWGKKVSKRDKKSDAFIAKLVAREYGIENIFFTSNKNDEDYKTIVDRFVTLGEGRIDHIQAYADGFNTWKRLFEKKILGIIRGDEAFGFNACDEQELSVRRTVGLMLCSDFPKLKKYELWGLPKQEIPEDYKLSMNESYETWRDRLYQIYRVPTILSALSDLKLSFVELSNPLLDSTLIYTMRKMPDQFRTDKSLFKNVMNSMTPNLPIATVGSNINRNHLLLESEFVNLLLSTLHSDSAKAILPSELIARVSRNLEKANWKKKMFIETKNNLSRILPKNIKDTLRPNNSSVSISYNLIAFRIHILVEMHKKLSKSSFDLRYDK